MISIWSQIKFRNIDPDLAASLLEQIESGADVEPILLQLKNACPPRGESRDLGLPHVTRDVTRDGAAGRARDKVVTFQEDFSVQNIWSIYWWSGWLLTVNIILS